MTEAILLHAGGAAHLHSFAGVLAGLAVFVLFLVALRVLSADASALDDRGE